MFHKMYSPLEGLGCRKSGCNKCGLKGCLAALPGNRPKSAFFALFRRVRRAPGKSRKRRRRAFFPQISSELLKPPSLKPPFAALQRGVGKPPGWKSPKDENYKNCIFEVCVRLSGGNLGTTFPIWGLGLRVPEWERQFWLMAADSNRNRSQSAAI